MIKINRLLVVAAFLAAFTALPVMAQTTPGAPSAGAPVPQGKIALIFSDLFQDPKTGIARINATMGALNREFQPRQTELNQMAQKLQQLQDEVKAAPQMEPKLLQSKIDQIDQMKKDYQRKGEDATTAYDKRKKEIFQPLQEDISKALEAFAKSHGIAVLIDGSAVPLAYAADAIDITRAFINEYNAKNPATAQLNPPK